MLTACRLAGLSALEAHYAGVTARLQSLATMRPADALTRFAAAAQRRVCGRLRALCAMGLASFFHRLGRAPWGRPRPGD
jgi:hypothetical protein